MNPFDFNNDAPQQFDNIPAGTLCKVRLSFQMPKPFDCGADPYFFKSQTSDAQYLSLDMVVMAGPYAKKHIFQNMMITGVSDKSINITRSTFRAMLESARGILPTDMSENAQRARQVSGFADFEGMEFAIKVGIEKGSAGYEDKNKIAVVITPDKKEYADIMAGKDVVGPAPLNKPAAQSAPAWAKPAEQAPANPQPQEAPAWAKPATDQAQTAASNAAPAEQESTVPAWAK